MENKCEPIQYSLDCPPGSILCLCSFYIVSLFFLPTIFNPHAPTLEQRTQQTSPPHVGPQQTISQHGTPTDTQPHSPLAILLHPRAASFVYRSG